MAPRYRLDGALNLQFRVDLTDTDRDLQLSQKLIVARHPSETPEHVVLRVLGWCLFYTPELRFGPGLSVRDTPDLWARDLGGTPTVWVECGAASPENLRQVMQHHRNAAIHVLFGDVAKKEEFIDGVSAMKRRPPSFGLLDLRAVEPGMVVGLAASDLQRRRWAVTLVGEHVYIDADGVGTDSPVARIPLPPET